MKRTTMGTAGVAAALLLPGTAMAHAGHDAAGFGAGFAHPFAGLDHLAAMVMVGLWAGLAYRQRRWAVPGLFVGAMLAGFAWGAAGLAFPLVEPLLVASVVVLALAILARFAFDARPPLAVAAPVVAMLAVAHGVAHGAEMPGAADPAGFACGLGAATILLHLAGLATATLLDRARPVRGARRPEWLR